MWRPTSRGAKTALVVLVAHLLVSASSLSGQERRSTAGARILATVVPSNRAGSDLDIVRAYAANRELPVWVQPPRREGDAFAERVRAVSPDVIVVWSYSMILPAAVLAAARRGAVNVHGGLLPQYRGGHVMQWAIINGEPETGVALHYMDAGVDTGPVIAQARFPIGSEDDAVSVKEKLKAAGAALLAEWWPRIVDGTAPRTPQDESKARYWRMRTVEDGCIDWSLGAEQICRLIRALACNSPGAYVDAEGQIISIRRARLIARLGGPHEPGSVISCDDSGLRIAAAGADLLITEAPVDGRALSGATLAEVVPRLVSTTHDRA